MCGCEHHWDRNAPCTCQCPSHEGVRREMAANAAAPETPSVALSEAIAVTLGDHQWSAIDPVCSCGWEWDLKAWCKTINTSADSLWVLKVAPTRRAAYERHVASIIAASVEADRGVAHECVGDCIAARTANAAVERVREVIHTLGALTPANEAEAEVQAAYTLALRAALDGVGRASGAGVAEATPTVIPHAHVMGAMCFRGCLGFSTPTPPGVSRPYQDDPAAPASNPTTASTTDTTPTGD